MDRRASVCDNEWLSGHGHRQRKLYSLARFPQRGDEGGSWFIIISNHISDSTDGDRILLL